VEVYLRSRLSFYDVNTENFSLPHEEKVTSPLLLLLLLLFYVIFSVSVISLRAVESLHK